LLLQVLDDDGVDIHLDESVFVRGKCGDDIVDFTRESSDWSENVDSVHEAHGWGGLDFGGSLLDDLRESIGVTLDDSKLLWISIVGADILRHLVNTILDIVEGFSDSWKIKLPHAAGNRWGCDCHRGEGEGNKSLELHLDRSFIEGNERRLKRVKVGCLIWVQNPGNQRSIYPVCATCATLIIQRVKLQ
jgi:hypothetical protein